MQGGSASGVALTAYVLVSLLENSGNPHVSEVIVYHYRAMPHVTLM